MSEFGAVEVIRDEAMMRCVWIGYDAKGAVVLTGLAGHKPQRVSDSLVVKIRMGVDVYDAFRRVVRAEEGARTLAAASLPTIADPVKQGGHHG